MRLVQFTLPDPKGSEAASDFEEDEVIRVGIQLGLDGDVVDLTGLETGHPGRRVVSAIDVIRHWGGPLAARVESLVREGQEGNGNIVKLQDVRLRAPITRPDKVICIGMNYYDHCAEQNMEPPKDPLVFSKFSSSIIGPEDDLHHPDVTEELDWEVELVIVVGKCGKNIPEDQAMEHVFGFTAAHDVSARDWQLKKNGGQWLLGKTMDGFCPLGPAVVSKEEIGDPNNLGLKCLVNGVTKQDSNTGQMIFKTEAIVSWVSKFFTLYPGDIILTGTPPGIGAFRKPPEFLQRGDVVECFVEKIGTIRNRIV